MLVAVLGSHSQFGHYLIYLIAPYLLMCVRDIMEDFLYVWFLNRVILMEFTNQISNGVVMSYFFI